MSDQTRIYTKTPPAKSTQSELNKGLLQHSATRAEKPSAIPPIVHEVLKSPGQPLEASTRAFMEPRFGHDFSRVRVHTDARAAESAREVNSLAYTVGQDIVFGEGQHAPETTAGKKLIAHELAHVVQNQLYPDFKGNGIAPANHPSEQEAELAARGISFDVSAIPGGVMQRKVTLLEKATQIELTEHKVTREFITSFLEAVRGVIPSECYEQLQKELSEPKNQAMFIAGELAGIVAGAAKDIWGSFSGLIELVVKTSPVYQVESELTSLFHLGFGGYNKEKLQNYMKTKSLMSALYEFVKAVVKDPDVLVTIAHELGNELGTMTGKWFTKDFMPSSSFSKGETVGEISGTILVEIALLFIGPEELAIRGGDIAAKAAKGTRLGKVILEAMEKIPLLKKLLEARNLSLAGREALNLSEKAVVIAEKEAEHLVPILEKEATRTAPALEKYGGTHGPSLPPKTGEPPLTSKMSEPQVKEPFTATHAGHEPVSSQTLTPANRQSMPKVDATQSQVSPTVKQNEAVVKQPVSSVEQSSGYVSEGTPKVPTKVNYDEHYTKDGRKKVLKPDVEYTSKEGYNYKTDSQGRVSHVEGELKLGDGKRNVYAQRVAGREDRLPDDEGGHLIASIFKGSGDLDNLVPMNGNLNKGEWKKLESMWAKQLEKGKTVRVKIKPIYKVDSQRPVSFEIEYKIGKGDLEFKEFLNKPGG